MTIDSFLRLVALTLATAQLGAAQTYTSCNPLKKTCPADTGLAKWELKTDFSSVSSAFAKWKTTAGTVESTSLGAKFTISKQGDAPTIESDFYIFFGHVDVKLKAANGTGIVSTYLLESDDLDEIDWEQISTDTTSIQTNYFGKGNTASHDRATTVTVTNPETTFHIYSIDWTPSRIEWLLDGEVVRTLKYANALSGAEYPQTPMRIKIGIWAGGDPDNSEGTIEWAGGETDYTDGPFTMYVESIKITNYNPARSYKYTDKTGSYASIGVSNGSSSTNLASTSSSLQSSISLSDSLADTSTSALLRVTSAASVSLYSPLMVAAMVTTTLGILHL